MIEFLRTITMKCEKCVTLIVQSVNISDDLIGLVTLALLLISFNKNKMYHTIILHFNF